MRPLFRRRAVVAEWRGGAFWSLELFRLIAQMIRGDVRANVKASVERDPLDAQSQCHHSEL